MSTFDPETFLTQTVDKPLETDYKLCPTGEYRANIDDFTSEAIEVINFEYKKGDRAGQPGEMVKFTCPFVIDDPKAQQALGTQRVVVGKQMILQMIDGTSEIDFGVNRNVELGRILKAVGIAPPWNVGQLRGKGPLMVRVVHRKGKRKDGSDFEMAEVDRVAPIR